MASQDYKLSIERWLQKIMVKLWDEKCLRETTQNIRSLSAL